jgi:hypothetical protein
MGRLPEGRDGGQHERRIEVSLVSRVARRWHSCCMTVSLLPKIEAPKSGDHHFALPVVRPVPRPPVATAPETW